MNWFSQKKNIEGYSIKVLDGFLQAIPECVSSPHHSFVQKENDRDLKIHAELSCYEDVSIFNGYHYSYSEYEEDVELNTKGRKLWNEIESTQTDKKSSIRILMLNLQLKDDSTDEMSELPSLDKVTCYQKILAEVSDYHIFSYNWNHFQII